MMHQKSSIEITEGAAIGYSTRLAKVSSKVLLGTGTHYLLARNGRGKTTLLRSVAGSIKFLEGGVNIKGAVQFVPEDIYYNASLTAKAVLKIFVPKVRREECLAFADGIELDVRKPYHKLSTGNQRKISWLMAEFSVERDAGGVILLDEPFTGVDSYVREKFLEYWDSHSEGVCRLVSCHPDFDSMAIESAVLISDGEVTAHKSEEMHSWGELKGMLK